MAKNAAKIHLADIKPTATCGICMQLFTKPRELKCGHTYCLVCLKSYQNSKSVVKECPQCRQVTVPISEELDTLPSDDLAADLVCLIHKYEPDAYGEIISALS